MFWSTFRSHSQSHKVQLDFLSTRHRYQPLKSAKRQSLELDLSGFQISLKLDGSGSMTLKLESRSHRSGKSTTIHWRIRQTENYKSGLRIGGTATQEGGLNRLLVCYTSHGTRGISQRELTRIFGVHKLALLNASGTGETRITAVSFCWIIESAAISFRVQICSLPFGEYYSR